MNGLTDKAAQAIENLIKGKFNAISLNILGIIPKVSKEKDIVFTTSRSNLISLFLQSLGSRNPNNIEEDTLKILLRIASGYIDALRDRTSSLVIDEINSYVRSTKKGEDPSMGKINELVEGHMDKAQNHLKLIANAESNKAVNTGTALQIAKIADEKGEKDPTVFFVVVIDERNDPETYRLHLLPDRLTPRVWKLSELNVGYHTKGNPQPSIIGTNPNCRCKLSYLTSDWSFKNGNVSFKELGWDELQYQRENYEMPKDETK